MASRYWVGGSGTWDSSSTTHWSATSGGAGGASVPTSADDVFVDALSGSSPVVLTSGTLNCLSLDFTGAITPTFQGSAALNIFGSLTYISAMTMTHSGATNFKATSTGKTITTALKTINEFVFAGVGGGWTFQDNVTTLNGITLTNGSLNTNGKTINTSDFFSSNTNIRTLTLGASIINLMGSWIFTTITNLTFTAGTSIINITGSTQFSGGGLTYNNFVASGTTITLLGSNTFNTLTINAGKTLKLTSGTTQTLTSLVSNGTVASKAVLNAVTSASAASISIASGNIAIRNVSLKDITATGGATFYALSSTDTSGNTGWAFQMLIKQEKLSGSLMALYHIDSTGTMTKVSG